MLEINNDTFSARDSDGPKTPTGDDEKGSVIRFAANLPSFYANYGFCPTDEEDCTSSLTFISLEESESEVLAPHGLSMINNVGSDYRTEYPGGNFRDEYELDTFCRWRKAKTPRRSSRRRKHARSLSDFAANRDQRNCLTQMFLRPRNGRTDSGTPVIASISVLNKCLPDYYCDYHSSCCYSESRSDTELELANSLTNITKSTQSPKLVPFRERSQRSYEIERQCPRILLIGGPRAGFYNMEGRVQGRRSWATDQSEIHWSTGAKAWLLRSKKARRGMCVAMLKEDCITPYGSPQPWRVSLLGKNRSVHEAYGFTPDESMTCTPASGFGVSRLLPAIKPTLELNTVVRIRRGLGVTRFIGELEDNDISGTFVGVELFSPNGLHNGIRNKMLYFEAKENHGVFVRYEGILEQFGQISQMGEVTLGNLLSKGRKVRSFTIRLENTITRTLLAIFDHRKIFCSNKEDSNKEDKEDILELILFYALVILC